MARGKLLSLEEAHCLFVGGDFGTADRKPAGFVLIGGGNGHGSADRIG